MKDAKWSNLIKIEKANSYDSNLISSFNKNWLLKANKEPATLETNEGISDNDDEETDHSESHNEGDQQANDDENHHAKNTEQFTPIVVAKKIRDSDILLDDTDFSNVNI